MALLRQPNKQDWAALRAPITDLGYGARTDIAARRQPGEPSCIARNARCASA